MAYSERHYGAGRPDCPLCHGLGYIRYHVPEEHPYFGKIFVCECRQAELEAEQVVYLRQLSGLETLGEKRLDNFDLGGMLLSAEQARNLQLVYEQVAAYANEPKGWLVLTGGYGCGKTHLAAAIANAQLEAGNKVIFVTVPDLLDHLRAAFQPGAVGSYDERFEEVRDAPLLILDDLGTENTTPWAVEKLYQILNHRHNTRLPTVVTSNRTIPELDARIRSRLGDLVVSRVLTITAPDYRQGNNGIEYNGLNALPLYHYMTFQSFSIRADELTKEYVENLRRARTMASQYVDTLEGWLLFAGPGGSGKTHLAAAIANACSAKRGIKALLVAVPDLLDHLRGTYAPDSTASYDRLFSEVKTAPLLVLDDLGTESATPWAREKIYQLFNYRYVTRLPTVITTIHRPEELDSRLLARLRDRSLCKWFLIEAPGYLGSKRDRSRNEGWAS